MILKINIKQHGRKYKNMYNTFSILDIYNTEKNKIREKTPHKSCFYYFLNIFITTSESSDKFSE